MCGTVFPAYAGERSHGFEFDLWGFFLSRFAAHFCAPVFVFLTGVSAWLYANRSHGQPRSARAF